MANAEPPLPDVDRYSQLELEALKTSAEKYVGTYDVRECKYLLRDKMPEYYEDIFTIDGGVMLPYIKDNGGDPRNPINCNIKGVFFNATVAENGGPPVISKYGTVRYSTRPIDLLKICPNIYFSDIYCVKRAHHVQLVLAKPGSIADQFCEQRVVKLDLKNNPFFRMTNLDPVGFPNTGKFQFWVPSGRGIKIELLFTENLHLRNRDCLQPVQLCYDRFAGGKGVKKNPRCKICNLLPEC